MRQSLHTLVVLATVALGGCIHLPAEVAAVVTRADPAGSNNFRPEPTAPKPASNAHSNVQNTAP